MIVKRLKECLQKMEKARDEFRSQLRSKKKEFENLEKEKVENQAKEKVENQESIPSEEDVVMKEHKVKSMEVEVDSEKKPFEEKEDVEMKEKKEEVEMKEKAEVEVEMKDPISLIF